MKTPGEVEPNISELEADAAYVSRIENGKKNPSLETVLKLAGAFGIKVMFGDKRL